MTSEFPGLAHGAPITIQVKVPANAAQQAEAALRAGGNVPAGAAAAAQGGQQRHVKQGEEGQWCSILSIDVIVICKGVKEGAGSIQERNVHNCKSVEVKLDHKIDAFIGWTFFMVEAVSAQVRAR